MKKYRRLFIGIITLLLVGCAVPPPVAYTGSKADGIISLSYKNPSLLTTQDWAKAENEATNRCQKWGFSGAMKFERERRVCISANAFGCIAWNYYVDYQCVD